MRNSFSYLSLMPGLLLGMVMFTSCGDNVDDNIVYGVGSVTLDKQTLTLSIGDAPAQLKATVGPENATYKTSVEWTSSDPDVATVAAYGEPLVVTKEVPDSAMTYDGEVIATGKMRTVTEVILTGVVTPVGQGVATIKASREGKVASCVVTVE